MGLLDADTEEGQKLLGLLAAAGPTTDPNKTGFGARLLMANEGLNAWKQQKQAAEYKAMQMEAAKRQWAQQEEEAQNKRDQAAWWDATPNVLNKKVYGASDVGPTMAPDTNAIQQHLLSRHSPFAQDLLKQQLFPKEKEGFTLSEGQQRYDGSGRLLVSAPPKPVAEDEFTQRMRLAGIEPNSPRGRELYQAWLTKQTTHQPASNQTVINAGPKAFETAMGGLDAKQLDEWRKTAEAGNAALGVVNRLRGAEKMGAFSGPSANIRLSAGRIIGDITGSVPKGVVGSELYNAEASNLVLEHVKALGANPSNADREFIEKTVPQLASSAAARKELSDFIEKKAKASISLYKSADTYARKNNGLRGFQQFDQGETDIDALVNKYR